MSTPFPDIYLVVFYCINSIYSFLVEKKVAFCFGTEAGEGNITWICGMVVVSWGYLDGENFENLPRSISSF